MKKDVSFKPAAFLSTAICFMFFMFSPVETYLTNKDEFWYDIYVLAPIMACVFLVFTAVCILGFFVLYKWSEKLYRAALLFLFITFICSYVQGNYLVKYLPVLDGRMIDWSKYSMGRVESIILWILVIAAVILLAKKLQRKQMDMLMQVISVCMVLMFIVTLSTLCITNQGMESKENTGVVTTYGEFTMSTDQNFIILLLDSVDAGAFSDIVIGNPEYEAIFDDFTYYDNVTSVYPHTNYNVPFIVSGMWFENKTDERTYFNEVLFESPVFSNLDKRDFSIALYELNIGIDDRMRDRFENVEMYTKKVSSYTTFARWQILLTGIKYAPFDLKRFSYVNPNAFPMLRMTEGNGKAFYYNNYQFYDQLMEEGITYREDKSFKFIHLWGAHPPYEQDKELNFLTEGGTYTQALEGCITLTNAYLEKLKESEVYDNSIIIIMADHGNSDYYNTEYYQQHPILLIKGLNERHDFQINDKAVSFEDLPDAYEKLLDGIAGGGQTVFDDLPQTRDRRFLYYDIKDDGYMIEYKQTGKAGDMSTMIPLGKEINQKSEQEK